MAVPSNDKHKQYARYAAYCLGIDPPLTDQVDRDIKRKMAREWVVLADAVIETPKLIRSDSP
jgi:hypothetical protein